MKHDPLLPRWKNASAWEWGHPMTLWPRASLDWWHRLFVRRVHVIPSVCAGHSSSSQCFCPWIFWGSWKYENPTIEHSSWKWKFLLDKLFILKCALCAQVQLPARWCGIFESWFLEFINHASTAVKISIPSYFRTRLKKQCLLNILFTQYSSRCKRSLSNAANMFYVSAYYFIFETFPDSDFNLVVARCIYSNKKSEFTFRSKKSNGKYSNERSFWRYKSRNFCVNNHY